MWRIFVFSLIVVVMVLTACDGLTDTAGAPDDQEVAGMPNPASEHCVEQGGKLEIRDEADGQVGYCVFPDGSECEEWAFMRGECAPGGQEVAGMPNPASEHCVDQGGELEIRDEADGQVGYCIFPDGSECEEWAFMRGECAPGGQEGAGMANPASEHCVDQGGELEIRDEADGQVGYCIFPDGSECEEWAFFQGQCAAGSTYQPLDPAACDDMAEAVRYTFTLDVATEQAAFDDYVAGINGSGCQATAVGTGTDFSSLAEAFTILDMVLEARGWKEDEQYHADGPTGTATAFRLEDKLCLSQISWEAADDADCAADQPISACELTPEQQLYTATLNCARRPASSESPVGLPNPASEYCVDQGGELEIRDEADGQAGYCLFPDGSECEEWAFFRGECKPAGN